MNVSKNHGSISQFYSKQDETVAGDQMVMSDIKRKNPVSSASSDRRLIRAGLL